MPAGTTRTPGALFRTVGSRAPRLGCRGSVREPIVPPMRRTVSIRGSCGWGRPCLPVPRGVLCGRFGPPGRPCRGRFRAGRRGSGPRGSLTAAVPELPTPPSPGARVGAGRSLTRDRARYGTTVQALVERERTPRPRPPPGWAAVPPSRDPAERIARPVRPVRALVGGMVLAGGRRPRAVPFRRPSGRDARTRASTSAAVSGQPILAAEAGCGIRRHPSWLREHGRPRAREGLRSLYAHNREISVALGDSVRRGETIALLGAVGERDDRPLPLRGPPGRGPARSAGARDASRRATAARP